MKRFCQQSLLDIFIFVHMKEAEEHFGVLVHLHSQRFVKATSLEDTVRVGADPINVKKKKTKSTSS